MKRSHQHGLLLLPMALMLAITGAVAYAVTRESSMSVAAIDARYEYEAARYLAEAGVNLAVWQNAKRLCAPPATFTPLALASGTISHAKPVTHSNGGARLVMTIVATFNGATHRIERKDSTAMHFYDMSREIKLPLIKGSDGNDTFIRDGLDSGQQGQKHLEVSDATGSNAHALVEFPTWSIPKHAKLIQAEVRLVLGSFGTMQPAPTLSVHRITRDWPDGTTWKSPWATDGGDYVPNPESTNPLRTNPLTGTFINALQPLPITALVDGWVNKDVPNYGVLVRTVGMTNARFASADNDTNRPWLAVTYHPACT